MNSSGPGPASAHGQWHLPVATGAVVLVLAAALGWWWSGGPQTPVPQPARGPAAVPVAVVAVQPAASASMAAAVVLTPASAAPGSRPDCRASEAPLARLRAGLVALLPGDAASSALLARYELASAELDRAGLAAHAAAVQRLRTSADPVQQAAGLFILSSPRLTGMEGCQGGDCSQALKRLDQAAVAPLAELATLARDTPSARVYGWAWNACSMARHKGWAPPACVGLNPQRWAQLAPDSAWPWLAQATQARLAGDVAGELGAMHRAAGATNWRSESGGLLRLLLAAQAPGQAAQVQRQTDLHALLTEVGALGMNLGGVGSYCGKPLDANRQQTCTAIAERLLTQADSLLHLGIGIGVAERSGWPAAKVAALRDESARLTQQSGTVDTVLSSVSSDPVTVCASLARMHQQIVQRAELGELGALRAQLGASQAPSAPAAR